ncbi:MAG: PRC-barrel domain-containing protein [Chthoniobacterales bacterium]
MNHTTTTPVTGTMDFRLGSDITGTTVYNSKNEELGTINELIVDGTKGHLRFAVLGIGGFLGMGETDVIVPWLAFKQRNLKDNNEMTYLLNVTREQLEKAPRFDREKLDQFYPREMSEPIFRHYGVEYRI